MGKIKSQGLANTFWTYIGIVAGGIYSIFIIPRAFADHPEYWGFVQFLVYYMQIFLPLAQLGVPNTIIRFFSKIEDKNLSSFYAFSLIITVILTGLVSVLYYQFGYLLANNQNTDLFDSYYQWLIPMLIGAAIFETLSAVSKAGLRSKLPVFLKDSFPKLATLILLTVYWLYPFSFNLFLIIYTGFYFVQFIIQFIYLITSHDFKFKADWSFFTGVTARSMYPYMILSMFITSTALWSLKIDMIMIGYLVDLQNVAFYSIAIYLATLIVIPFRSMSTIAAPMVAGFWNSDQLSDIDIILKKVSEISLVVGSYIFIMLWFNIDWIMHVLGSQFGSIKWVFLIIGISKLVDSSFSINGSILLTSKYYLYDLMFQIILVSLAVGLNFWLIPRYNLEGAAIATLIAIVVYNLMKWGFLFVKFNLNPFTMSTITSLAVLVILTILSFFNPIKLSFWVNGVITSIAITSIYLLGVFRGNLSAELKQSLLLAIHQFKSRI